MSPALLTLSAFLRARLLMRRLRTRVSLEAFQQRQVSRFLRDAVPGVAAFSDMRLASLSDAPVMDKAGLMAGFDRYNRLGLTADEGWAIFDGQAPERKGYSVGASTGTSGNRGLYVISERERYLWLGVMLSRTLPHILTRSERVAVMLPQASRLYDAANESRRLTLKFFDLAEGFDHLVQPLARFSPTVIVAPPRILRALAAADVSLSPRQVFSGGEVLDSLDRQPIEARFGTPARQIYMATEGLFAVSCEQGRLHMIEDHVAFETFPVSGSDTHVNPVITDFSRRTQIMLRYRMNDVVMVDAAPCPCGSVHRVLSSVVGRLDDSFELAGPSGKPVLLTPDVIRNAVVGSDRRIGDFRVVLVAANHVIVRLKPEHAGLLDGACAALKAVFSRSGAEVSVEGDDTLVPECGARKVRRVEVALDRTKS